MKYTIETQKEQVFNSYLDQTVTTVYCYEIDGNSVVLKEKEYDSSLGADRGAASRAKFKVAARGKVIPLSEKYGKLYFKDQYDVFIDFSDCSLLKKTDQSVSYSFKFTTDEKKRISSAFKTAGTVFRNLFSETEEREIKFDFPDAVPDILLEGNSGRVRSLTIGSSVKGIGMKIQYFAEQHRILFYVLNPEESTIWRGDLVFGRTSWFTVYFHSLDPMQNQKFGKFSKKQ
ncbi:MAG TPA: hypothetical protein PKN56_15535 [Leptospiraceae bacterium]|nr:hypothetical protein [Leptospiraceae bacterium]HMY69488.1 hypothetical protein [Leptospiraceae bacterium]HNF24545.1 hypothetical protein [Leptospiraceae bacterium]HNI96515.1 hypothetical protein [Leptospiraceae bacterium]HNN04977.1 hypothetical protein [Leptospiraceae bacterium]